jgi:hypothetical protein
MHKEISVMDIEIDDITGNITHLSKLHNIDHLPLGIMTSNNFIDRKRFNIWWTNRAIPVSREGLDIFLNAINLSTPELLMTKSYGLSLSDQYWVKEKGSSLSWDKINFFDNNFSSNIIDLFKEEFNFIEDICIDTDLSQNINIISPDTSSPGKLSKKWKIINDKRFLFKSGSKPFKQEPFNEYFASFLLTKLNISHVNYSLIPNKNQYLSVCENFINKNTELVDAYQIFWTSKILKSVSKYHTFIDNANNLYIPNPIDFFNKIITLDYIIVNSDRHHSNFGAIRDANNLKFISMAPIFDNGNSLWFDFQNHEINRYNIPKSRMFLSNHEDQLKLVSNFDWLDASNLKNIDSDFYTILSYDKFMLEQRKILLCESLKERVTKLEQFINNPSTKHK